MLDVTLVSHTPDPDKLIACAAKMCYSDAGAHDIMDGMDEASCAKFIDRLTSLGHESPIEHASFSFAIEGVSRSLLAQITRHRIASFSVKSQRYVREMDFSYVTPPEIAACPEAYAIFERAMAQDRENYDAIEKVLFEKHFAANSDAGMDEKSARRAAEKNAIEDARFVLPNACETKMILTMNVRSLLNFFRLRCCNRAQWEIRELAERMLVLCRAVSPRLFASAGPACIAGA
ncbi:MAG: FAD-dependent thymidylate synthase, partial [Clostridia bacterium]